MRRNSAWRSAGVDVDGDQPADVCCGIIHHYESRLAAILIYLLEQFLEQHDLGIVLGADGTLRLIPGLVRIPDVSFIAWERLYNRERPTQPIPDLVPDLAVEVLSVGNTPGEMDRKLQDYFTTGVRLVWHLDPETRTARVYTSPTQVSILSENDTLEGGDVLPGFQLLLRVWFERAWRKPSE